MSDGEEQNTLSNSNSRTQISRRSFYASLFILTLRFANDWAWVFFVIYPVLVLFGIGYRLLPHYASIRFCGNLTLDSAVGQEGRGGTQSFDTGH